MTTGRSIQNPAAIAHQFFLLALITGAAGFAGAAEICQPSTPGYFHKYLSGKIDGKYAFTMELICREGALRGTYRYASRTMPIYLIGNVGPGATVALEEMAKDNLPITGSFTGTLRGNHVDGVWVAPDGKKRLPFTAEQTSEIHLGTRREIVSGTVGDYALVSITGHGGANAMWETWKTKKGWDSNVSSISRAVRESSDIELTPADERLLDSLTIRIRPDLTTELLALGSVILAIPYSDRGARFNVTSDANADVRRSLEKPWTEARLEDETVYLLGQDGVDFSRHIAGNFQGVVGDVLLVRYAIPNDSFTVEFMDGECCNSSTFTFRRQRSPQK